MVRPLWQHAHPFRSTATDLVAGYAARYQNQQGKTGYVVPGLDAAQVITVYGVASRTSLQNQAGLLMLWSIPDYADNAYKQDLIFCLESSNYGIKGLAENTYTAGFEGNPTLLPALAANTLFQYSVRFYNAHPEKFELRVNGQPVAVRSNGQADGVRYFSQMFWLGGDNSSDDLNWQGTLNDTIIYLSNQPASTDAQNEAYLLDLYNIAH